MVKSTMTILMMILMLGLISCQTYHGHDWQTKSAQDKLTALNSAIFHDTKSNSWPSALEEGELFVESMATSFDNVGDDMPKQFLNIETRKKLIHSVGVVLEVEYVSLNRTFTGIFRSGCKNAFLRFSVAVAPSTNNDNGNPITPGLAIKFLRNGVPSANIFAMYSLLGQPSFNFFKHDFSSHAPDLPNSAPSSLQLIRWRFTSASNFPVFIGNSEIAKYDENGRSFSPLSFPFRLHFHPNSTLHRLLPDNYTGEAFEDQLTKILHTPGQHLYDVYAQETPFSDKLVLIGKVVSKNYATRSFFGDRNLFYQHTRFEDDLLTYPSWKAAAQSIIDKQRQETGDGYHYPDLPWN